MKFVLKPRFAALLGTAEVEQVNASMEAVTKLQKPDSEVAAAFALQSHLFDLVEAPGDKDLGD